MCGRERGCRCGVTFLFLSSAKFFSHFFPSVPDSYRGEAVKAYVSLQEGLVVTPYQIIEHCKKRISAFKVPRLVEIIEELPKNLSGKILRRELRMLHEQKNKSKL